MKLLALTLLCSVAIGISQLQADVIVGWNMNGNDSADLPTAADYLTTVDPNVTVGDWTLSSVSPPQVRVIQDFYATGGYANQLSLDTSKLYTSFTVTPDAGYSLDLTSLTFSSSILSGDNGPTTGAWGFRTIEDGVPGSWTTFSFPLGELIFDSADLMTWNFETPISTEDSVEFGFWAWGGTVDFPVIVSSGIIDGGLSDGLTVNGTVNAVPEPSAYVLISFGMAVILVYRRYMRRDTLVA